MDRYSEDLAAMDSARDTILKASRHFTKGQKSRLIAPWDLLDAAMKFGCLIHWQLKKDYWSQFRFWDSASMILQSEELCPTEDEVRAFAQWAIGILDYQGPVDE